MVKKIVFGFIGMVAGIYMVILMYVGMNVYKDNKMKSDVVLVLGAKANKDGGYNPCLVARVQHGVELYKSGYGKKLIFSGGTDREDGANEAETMQRIAVELGVKGEDVLLEKESTSTWENMVNTHKIMEENGLEGVVVVTEPFHMPRADLIAGKLKIIHTVSPATESQCWQRWKFLSRYFLKEPVAILYYWLRGRI